ncbi:MAG: mandelate racemase [Proteobacteria bacterium]|nr:mandelate racemase [Pseudomonadota bacterium]
MTAPRLKVLEVHIHERPVVLRLPFRFGVVTLKECPQAFARVLVDVEGHGEAWGMAGEALAPKWFDKSPALSNDDNLDQLRTSLRLAAEAYMAAGPLTAFDLYRTRYPDQMSEGAAAGLPPLAAGYGQALIDRAILDAACMSTISTFSAAIQSNLPGITTDLTPDLAGFAVDEFLAGLTPLQQVAARHTVGMIDPLTAADQSPGERLDDGLPETLEEVIAAYGTRHFKIKITGDVDEDTERLARVAATLDGISEPYVASIDGNEQYQSQDGVLALFSRLDAAKQPALQRFLASTSYIEQPINRAVSLETPVHEIAKRAPLIIDESDGTIDAFPAHRALGYSGVSSKTCKGFYKSILNAARCVKWNAEADGRSYFLSGEDLTCQAGVALQQDLALVALLGIDHVERNGHHYTLGMSAAPAEEQRRFLTSFPDLYRDVGGVTCARIENGQMSTKSILAGLGWGSAEAPDWTVMEMPMTYGGSL